MRPQIIAFFLFLSSIASLASTKPKYNEETLPTATIPFITTWKTDNPGDTNNNQIRISTSANDIYNYTVDWGDGTITTGEAGDAVHTYATPGTYTVGITGLFPRIVFGIDDDQEKLLTIEQWGDNQWTSMLNAFLRCSNLTGNFSDVPDLSNVTNMGGMFNGCTLYNSDMNNWDVSNVTEMSGLFREATSFNTPIGNWNVSNVQAMQAMFYRATSFNQDIGNWNISNVTNMWSMFSSASAFNQDISLKPGMGNPTGDAWNTLNVTTMRDMFNDASAFNQNIGNWNTENVIVMLRMFKGCSAFNQDISAWNVGNVENFSTMFSAATSFDQDIGGWDTANATTMWQMFSSATNFDQNLGAWDVSNVTDMRNMFATVALSPSNYDALLIGWNAQNLQPNLEFNGGNSQYCAGAAARANIIASDTWTIADGGPASPTVNDVPHQTHVTNFTLPTITGNNLTGGEQYYTAINGGGTPYAAGTTINYADFTMYPVTLYIYDGAGACSSQEDFNLILTIACTPPVIDDLADQNVQNSFTLPTITGTNLTGAEAYFTGPMGSSTQYNATDVIDYADFAAYPVTLYIFDGTLTCSSQQDFSLTITSGCVTPTADSPTDVEACGSYTLPALSSGNRYYTATNAGGMLLNAGETITTSQMLYVFAGSESCSDENSFVVTIDLPMPVDILESVTECESYTLPILANGNYYTEAGGGGTELFTGEVITTSQEIFIYFESGTCSDEHSFNVTIDPSLCEEKEIEEEEEIVDTCEFPKFFTPNGDGINDRFELANNDCGFSGELRIYDRYGKLVFQTSRLDKSWDGTLSGQPMPASDYWYQFVDSESGQLVIKHFSLKR